VSAEPRFPGAPPRSPDRDAGAGGTPAASVAAVGTPAFDDVYLRFASTVHGIVLSRVGPSDADDLVQEAFVSIHRGLATLRDAAALPAWVCAVARNAATDFLRRRARVPRREPLDDVAAPRAGADARELRERVLARIQELPDAYREPLVLRLVEGLTGPEIAERTGLQPTSVRVNLTRGMAMLRPLLAKEGWGVR
jgi:RNA polymerase sigma-70 factor (ECF subfamily)